MEKEIMDIVYERSMENKFLTDDDTLKILKLFKSMYNLGDQLTNLTIASGSTLPRVCSYDHKDKKIVVYKANMNAKKDLFTDTYGGFLQGDFVLFYNLFYVSCLLHEVRHAMEKTLVIDSLATELVAREYEVLHDPNRYDNLGYSSEEIEAFSRWDRHCYHTFYDFLPSERLANISSLKSVIEMANNDERFSSKIKDVFTYMLCLRRLQKYPKNLLPPTIKFIIEGMRLDQFDDLSIFDKESGKLLHDTTEHSLDERLEAGLFLTQEEYDSILENTLELNNIVVRQRK